MSEKLNDLLHRFPEDGKKHTTPRRLSAEELEKLEEICRRECRAALIHIVKLMQEFWISHAGAFIEGEDATDDAGNDGP